MRHRIALCALVVLGALIVAAAASAHAEVSPPAPLAKELQVFTLAVPTEEEGATTTTIEMTPPQGFNIDSFYPSSGWKRTALTKGSGEDATVTKVTWSGGATPTEEDSVFSFLASTSGTGDYSFTVRQTYSNGKVVTWSGPESSDTPAPVVHAVSSIGGGGGTSTLAIVALVLGALALIVALVGLLLRGGGGSSEGRELA
jgi:uncharacterized protein YcnI